MRFEEKITTWVTAIETKANDLSWAWLPLKLLLWLIFILALNCLTLIATARWPYAALKKIVTKQSSGQIINLKSTEDLQPLASSHPHILLDFWGEWCGPCLLMNRSLEAIAQRYAGRVLIVKIDVSLKSTEMKKHDVRGLPTLILLNNGQEKARIAAALTEAQIARFIDDHINGESKS